MDAPIPFADCFTRPEDAVTPWVFLGLPDDSQSSFLKGSAQAPRCIRAAYDGRCFNATSESGVDLTRSVVDLGDLEPRTAWLASFQDYRARIVSLLKERQTPFVVGGDHAVTVPIVSALEVLAHPVHVIQVDAHPDLYPDFEGNPDSHACTAARLLEMAHVASLTQLGIRTMNHEQRPQKERYGNRLRIYEARDLPGELPRLEHIPEGAATYVTIDMDGFDPSFAPGVSHPVPGGLSARQVLSFLQRGHWTLVGMDVVEVNPPRDRDFQTAILAARLLHEGIAYAAGRARAN
jgi:arginase